MRKHGAKQQRELLEFHLSISENFKFHLQSKLVTVDSIQSLKASLKASERAKYTLFTAGYGHAKMLPAHLTQARCHGPALGEERFEWFPCSGSSEMGTTVYSTTSPAAFIESVAFH